MSAASADLRSLAMALDRASHQGIQSAAVQVVRDGAVRVQHTAQILAPKRTGALAASITVVFTTATRAVVGPQLKYGVFQEFGTQGPYIIKPRRPDGLLVFEVNGKTVFARQVTHPGLKPHSFMVPALEQVVNQMAAELGVAGAQLITYGA